MEMDQIRQSALSLADASDGAMVMRSSNQTDHGKFGPMSDEPRVTHAQQLHHLPMDANPDSSFNNRVAETLTDHQRSIYSQKAKGGPATGFNNGPLSPPSQNPLAENWNRLDPHN